MIDKKLFRDSVLAKVDGEIKAVVRVDYNNSNKYIDLLNPSIEYNLNEDDIINRITFYADYSELLSIVSLKISDEEIKRFINRSIKEAEAVKRLIKE